MLVHSGNDMEFFVNAGESDYLLVTFGELAYLADGTRYWGKPMIERNKINAIGIAARSPNWYPKPDIDAFIAAQQPLLDRFKGRIVVAGHSMGGYAAIKHSRRLGASTVIATVPQYTLDRSSLPNNTRPPISYFNPALHTGMEPKPEELSGQIYILCDFGHSGRPQFDAYVRMGLDNSHVFPVPYTGHECVTVFAKNDGFLDLVGLCRAGDEAAIRRFIRQCRKDTNLRVVTIALRLAARRPKLALEVYRKYESRFGPAYMALLGQALSTAFPKEGAALVDRAIAMKPDLTKFSVVSDLLAKRGRMAESAAMGVVLPPL
jgi:hypothetical protein